MVFLLQAAGQGVFGVVWRDDNKPMRLHAIKKHDRNVTNVTAEWTLI